MLRFLLTTCVLLLSLPAQAAEIALPHEGRNLLAEVTMAPGKQLKDGVVIIVHDDRQTATAPLPRGLARDLAARGRNALAITLSLGLDERRNALGCDALQAHKQSDAVAEVKAWLDWTKAQGIEDVSLVGFGRGANQVAQYLTAGRDLIVSHAVLVAPTSWAAGQAEAYRARFGDDLGQRFREARDKVKAGKGNERMEGVGFLDCPKAAVTADAFADHYAPNARLDTLGLVQRIKQPTLLIAAGGGDVERMRQLRGEQIVTAELPEVAEPIIGKLGELIDRFLAR